MTEQGVVEYFFRLHFYNFEADLTECLAHVANGPRKTRRISFGFEEEWRFFFRIPRGFNDYNDKGFGNLNNSKDLGRLRRKRKKNE